LAGGVKLIEDDLGIVGIVNNIIFASLRGGEEGSQSHRANEVVVECGVDPGVKDSR
jgi:hypothetical protein